MSSLIVLGPSDGAARTAAGRWVGDAVL